MEMQSASNTHHKTRMIENVLVLQGGGSLGAFACGVYKTLAKHGLKFDIITGTSIGAINGAIIAGSKNSHPEKDLENFWLELAESSQKIFPSDPLNAWKYGVPKFFLPRWHWNYMFTDTNFFLPTKWTYLFDNSLLLDTLKNYIDYDRLGPKKDSSTPRLIITAVDVLTSKHLEFDSQKQQIDEKHILASSGYPLNGFPWVKVNEEQYAWDGSLISNTPLRQAFKASPRNDKNLYIIENYAKIRTELPSNMIEVFDRANDILFIDKTRYDIEISRKITKMIMLIENMYEIVEKNVDGFKNSSNEDFKRIKSDYQKIVEKAGSEILSVYNISRDVMENPHPLKNADFSLDTIKDLISQGEQKAEEKLNEPQ
ncbi:MAG: patatin-like phospholipase family protein [Thaumarchaeota archaeon]|nr:patatin-like phospholipase family protein [Nitrososphaerota archaeon]